MGKLTIFADMNISELKIGTPIRVKESNDRWGDYWSDGTINGKSSNYVEITYRRGFHAEWEMYMHYRNQIVERIYFDPAKGFESDRISTAMDI